MQRTWTLATGLAIIAMAASAVPAVAAAPTSQPELAPVTITGLSAPLPDDGGRPIQLLGRMGCLRISSMARYGEVLRRLADAGWQMPPQNASRVLYLDREDVIVLYHVGDEGDRFVRHAYSRKGDAGTLDLVMGYVIYKQREKAVSKLNVLITTVPRTQTLKVNVATYHPLNGGPHPTPDKALPEWSHTFGPDSGDMVDGLSAHVSAKDATVAPDQDILLTLTLKFTDEALVKDGHFASRGVTSATVWDGKYSNGYRNAWFIADTPDGGRMPLIPPEILNWDKNAPHPVEITAEKPYVVSSWATQTKSLKTLGLETTRPGRYRVIAMYNEIGGPQKTSGDKSVTFWAGSIASSPITVTVAAPPPARSKS